MPHDSKVLRPKVPPPFMYADREPGVIDVSIDGKIRTKVKLFKNEPGIYTIVTWLKKGPSGKAFPATEVCVESL